MNRFVTASPPASSGCKWFAAMSRLFTVFHECYAQRYLPLRSFQATNVCSPRNGRRQASIFRVAAPHHAANVTFMSIPLMSSCEWATLQVVTLTYSSLLLSSCRLPRAELPPCSARRAAATPPSSSGRRRVGRYARYACSLHAAWLGHQTTMSYQSGRLPASPPPSGQHIRDTAGKGEHLSVKYPRPPPVQVIRVMRMSETCYRNGSPPSNRSVPSRRPVLPLSVAVTVGNKFSQRRKGEQHVALPPAHIISHTTLSQVKRHDINK